MELFPGIDTIGSGNLERPLQSPARTRGGLLSPIDRFFLPEFERLQGGQESLENLFLNRVQSPVDFERFRAPLESFAQSVQGELFSPGGAVDTASRAALDTEIQAGRGPRSGSFNRSRLDILGQASDTLSGAIGQAAPQIAQTAVINRGQDIESLFRLLGLQSGRLDDIRDSLFTGEAAEVQRGFTRESLDLNRRLIEASLGGGGGGGIGGFLRSLGSGLFGSAIGPLGATLGISGGRAIFDALFGSDRSQDGLQ